MVAGALQTHGWTGNASGRFHHFEKGRGVDSWVVLRYVCLPDMDKEGGRTSHAIVCVWTLKIGCMWKSRIYSDEMIDERLAVFRYRIQNKETMERHGMNSEATLKLEGLKQEKT